ncbi:hypothetical protein [Dipodfec virus UOA04_Rod_386]|nr:hypothetical protein [Dipodfec virus UOA04_Rod_386]
MSAISLSRKIPASRILLEFSFYIHIFLIYTFLKSAVVRRRSFFYGLLVSHERDVVESELCERRILNHAKRCSVLRHRVAQRVAKRNAWRCFITAPIQIKPAAGDYLAYHGVDKRSAVVALLGVAKRSLKRTRQLVEYCSVVKTKRSIFDELKSVRFSPLYTY